MTIWYTDEIARVNISAPQLVRPYLCALLRRRFNPQFMFRSLCSKVGKVLIFIGGRLHIVRDGGGAIRDVTVSIFEIFNECFVVHALIRPINLQSVIVRALLQHVVSYRPYYKKKRTWKLDIIPTEKRYINDDCQVSIDPCWKKI